MAGRGPSGSEILQSLITALQGFAQNQAPNVPAPLTTNQVIEQIRRCTPLTFNGHIGPLALDEWVMGFERIFEYMEYTNAQKVACATYQLTEDAGHWWQSCKRDMTEEARRDLTWERFKEIVMEKYFPCSFRNQKQKEFLDLKQGHESVTEYECKFNQHSRYATRILQTKEERADWFQRGLQSEIRGISAAQRIVDYGRAVTQAHEIEMDLEIDRVIPRGGVDDRKRKWNNNDGKRENAPDKQERIASRSTYVEIPPCSECKKRHLEKYFWNKGV